MVDRLVDAVRVLAICPSHRAISDPRGVLMAFLTADELPRDPVQRRQQVLAGLARLFGSRAKSPLAYFETGWSSDGWSTGCVSPLSRNITSRFGPALRAQVGRVHWAGTETSEVWCGYMEGAVRSGERITTEILAALVELLDKSQGLDR
jgi:monoamine oxidase